MYRHVEAGLLRAAAYPIGLCPPPRPAPTGETELDTNRQRQWISQVWALLPVAEAIEVASPAFAGHIEKVCSGHELRPKKIQHAEAALARYLLRFQHRCTPFGLFAGITPIRITDTLTLDWTDEHRPTARVDAVWLTKAIRRLESIPTLLRLLPVVVDSTSFLRDERLVVPCQRPDHDSDRGPGEVSVRNTPAVQRVVAAATTPVAAGDLTAKLAAEFPTIPVEHVETLVAELVARRVLLTALRPPMTSTDPLGHVIDVLEAAGAQHIDAARPTVNALNDLRVTLIRHDQAPPSQRRSLRASATAAAIAAFPGDEAPVAVDLRLGASLTLPRLVAQEAETATDLLARITPFPSGSPAWQDYHARFLETYGPDAVVSVRQLTDPDTGLDLPAGYRGSLNAPATPALTARDDQLLAIAQRAAFDRAREVHLTDAMINTLENDPGGIPLPHLDLRFHIQAPTRLAIEHGDFTLHVSGIAPTAGATAGRFLDILDPSDRAHMTTAYATVPTLTAGAVRIQVSSPPLHIRTENVSRAPAAQPLVISIAEYHDEARLELDDLAVTADATGFRLIQLSTGRPVEPFVLNAVDLGTFTHPLARFLIELPRARAAAFGPFAWGAASRLPFLPRIRYGRSILAPATWRLDAAELPGTGTEFGLWAERLNTWRERLGVPGSVLLGNDDQQLRLDLDQPTDAMLLRDKLNRARHAVLREADDTTARGWIDGRPHEITLALASTARPAPHQHTALATTVDRGHGHLPGASPWAYVKLYSHPDREPAILTRHLPHLLDSLGPVSEWWFVRYRDPHDHVRLRFRLPNPDSFGEVAATVGNWAAGLRRHGLLGGIQWDTYRPETGRYGTGQAMAAAETVFAADSGAALAHLRCVTASGTHPHALITASLLDMADSFTGDTHAAMCWLIDHITTRTAGHAARPVHQQAMHLADPSNGFAAVRDLPGGEALIDAWAARRQALQRYRAALEVAGIREPAMPLPSLMHLAYLRTVGIDRPGEDICSRLVRSAALAWTIRTPGGPT